MPDMARIIHRLADSGVFKVGGVLVGTVAFQVLGAQLGVGWAGEARSTQDVDIASDTTVAIAVPDLKADVPAAIESLRMGFFPVPRLSRTEPSTSYAIRGRTLRVDLLTTARKGVTAPVFIRRLGPWRNLEEKSRSGLRSSRHRAVSGPQWKGCGGQRALLAAACRLQEMTD